MQPLDLIGYLSGIILPFVAVPQLIRVLKLKHAGSLSLTTYFMLFVGQGSQVIYAIHIHAWPVLMSGGFGFCVNTTLLIIMLRWRNAEHQPRHS